MGTANVTLPIIGVSPRNPYYANAENIAFVLNEALRTHHTVCVMVPDIPDVHNYLAYGYDEATARKKASAIGVTVKNTVREVCTRNGFSHADSHALAQVHIIDWKSEIENSPLYRSRFAEIKSLYDRDADFRADVRQITADSIHSRLAHRISCNDAATMLITQKGIDRAVDEGVNYPIAEIAFLKSAPALFGVEGVAYYYHRAWPVYDNFIGRRYSCGRADELGFRLVNRQATP